MCLSYNSTLALDVQITTRTCPTYPLFFEQQEEEPKGNSLTFLSWLGSLLSQANWLHT